MVMIVVSVVSGLAGVLVALWWGHYVSTRSEKVLVFRTLMSCRCHIVAEENVKALNLIDVVFYPHDDVRQCFKEFVDAACKTPFSNQVLVSRCLKLVESIAKVLGYSKIDWSRIDECVYYPKGMSDKIAEEELLRKASLQNQIAAAGRKSGVSQQALS